MIPIKRKLFTIKLISLIFIIMLSLLLNNMLSKKVVGGVVYKINEDESIDYLLVKTKNDEKWIFPKGKVKFYESRKQAVLREVGEEAGVKAKISFELKSNPFTFQKSSGKKQIINLYAMEYSKEKRHWKEETQRIRKWMTFPEASSVLAPEFLLALEEVQGTLNNKTKSE
jgi:ADP-ribose pyrophosphatase YjhB (NUDIX family)